MASLVNHNISKKSIAKRYDAPCFSLKFYRLPATQQHNALGVIFDGLAVTLSRTLIPSKGEQTDKLISPLNERGE